MRIAIIGAGFTGLSSAYQLIHQGHQVTVFEIDNKPGGLALGFQDPSWEWSLEKHYDHWFTNDFHILNLAKDLHYEVIVQRPKTSVYLDKQMFQFDSPKNVLLFPKLTLLEKLRMSSVVGGLRVNPFWKPLERFNTTEFLEKLMGKRAYKMIWEPQMVNKFGTYADDISLAWFWARIKKRTPSLAYPQRGFLAFAEYLVKHIEQKGARFLFNTEILSLDQVKGKVSITSISNSKKKAEQFDKVIVTLPGSLFAKISPTLPDGYKKRLMVLKGLGAINLVLRLKKQFLTDNTYWLSICEKNAPIMAIVEHTNFMDKKHYNNEHIVYLGNYLPREHPYFSYSAEKLLEAYEPLLKKVQPKFRESLIALHMFTVPFAQPIIPRNYSKIIPPFETPFSNVFLANMQQVYPWDRGTNYAVELGEKVAKLI